MNDKDLPSIFCVIFDGPPSHESGRFVEVEDSDGRSIGHGEWKELPDGLWELRFDYVQLQAERDALKSQREALEKALQHAIYRIHDYAAGCDGCRKGAEILDTVQQGKEKG